MTSSSRAQGGLAPLDGSMALLVVSIWGTNFFAAKTALAVIPPFLFIALRFGLVGVLLAPWRLPRRDQVPGLVAMALVLGVGHFGLIFFGLAGMDAATTAIVTQLGVPFNVLLAWLVFGERLGWVRLVGLVMAFAGVALLAGEPNLPDFLPFGVAVLSMLAWAVSNVMVKRMDALPPLAMNGWVGLFTCPMLLVLSGLFEQGQWQAVTALTQDIRLAAALSYTVVLSTLVAYSLWYWLLERNAMNRLVPVTLLGPVIGVAAGVIGLGEDLTWHKLVGGAITIGGVALMEVYGNRPDAVD